MSEFSSLYWQALGSGANLALTITGFVVLVSASVVGFIILRKPKWESKMKHLFWIIPLGVFIFVTSFFVSGFLISRSIWQEEQKQINELQTQINELQTQLSSITSLTFTQLPITDEHINAPDTEEIELTVTPAFNPAYSGTIPLVIENIDQSNHVREFVKITVTPASAEFKFSNITVLPPNVLIVNQYSGTNEIIMMINDIAPGGRITIDFPIYSMNTDPAIRGTAELNFEILYKGIIPQ